MDADGPGAFWTLSADDLAVRLGTGVDGLAAQEAGRRLERFGPNAVETHAHDDAVRMLWRQFESPLVLILIFAAAVSLTLRDWIEAAIVMVIVLGSVALGFVQEFRASAAVRRLREGLALTATVRRDGQRLSVPVVEIVPGDVVELGPGNLVPADGVLLEARDLLMSEAALTGESFPVEKRPGVSAHDAAPGARANAVFLGTSVRSGTATMLVASTGTRTVLGDIAGRLAEQAPETEFERGIREFGRLLTRVMVLMVLFVLLVNTVLDRPPIESLLFAVALAVGLSPELLPAIISVTLSKGARAMAARGVVVRRLEAIENLASMEVLCTDKTGTLTEGAVELADSLGPDATTSPQVQAWAFLNAQLQSGPENPLDAAIRTRGAPDGFDVASWRKVDEVPYDFERRRVSVVVSGPAEPATHRLVTKGAFDGVLSCCTSVATAQGEVPLDEPARKRLRELFRERGEAGYRVLGVAVRQCAPQATYGVDDERGQTFVGFLLFYDPIKPQIVDTLMSLEALGVKVKLVSGDNRYVAAHVAQAIGLDPAALMTGAQVEALRDAALAHVVGRVDVFAETDPQQKERIVRALRRAGRAVGYMGDGINDGPALHAADVGVSVDRAVDVARESADIVLLQPDLDVLRAGVEEGRRTFANTLKYICITTSANFGNMISMALASVFLPFLPLLAKQILLNNFLSDFPSIAISTDRVDPSAIERAQRWDIRDIRAFMVTFGLVSTVFDLLTFALLLRVFDADEPLFQTTWFVVSLLTELAVVLVLRTHLPLGRSRPGALLLWSTLVVIAVALASPYLGPVARVFGFVPLPPNLLAAGVAVVLVYLAVTEATKRWFFARREPTRARRGARRRRRPAA